MGRPTPDLEGLGYLLQRLEELEAFVRGVSGFDGTQLVGLVDQVRAALADLTNQVAREIEAQSYTRTQIDARFAAKTHGHDQADITGPWSKAVNTTDAATVGALTANGAVRTPAVYGTEITGTRRTLWIQDDGRQGYAASTETVKSAVRPAVIDVPGVGALQVHEFYYRAEIRRRTLLRIRDGIDYRPRREVGLLAHEVAAVAPWLVYFDADGNPEGVEYAMLAVALLPVIQQQRAHLDDHEARLAALEQTGVSDAT